MGRNIGNFTTFNEVLATKVDIQTGSQAISVYGSDSTSPDFVFDESSKELTLTDLNVTGSATFTNIDIKQFTAGLLDLASGNTGNVIDLGISAEYVSGSTLYTGLIKDVSDPLARWTFFNNITTKPDTTVQGIDYTKLDSIRANAVYVNDGLVGSPSITFHNDVNNDTGLYRVGEDEIGIVAGGKKIVDIKYTSSIASSVTLDATTTLSLQALGTVNDSASINTTYTKGSIQLAALSSSDKWLQLVNGTSSNSGLVFSSPAASTNYFITATSTGLQLGYTTYDSIPDYHNTFTELLRISTSGITSNSIMQFPAGNSVSPSIQFTAHGTSGAYQTSDGGISIACSGSDTLKTSSTTNTSYKPMLFTDGSSTIPSISFTNSTNSGLYNSAGSIGISSNGQSCITFSNTIQPLLPLALQSSFQRNIKMISTTSVTLDNSYNIVLLSYQTNNTNVQVSLPPVGSYTGIEYIIIKTGNGGGSVIVQANGTDLIDTTQSITLSSQYDRLTIISDGSLWHSM